MNLWIGIAFSHPFFIILLFSFLKSDVIIYELRVTSYEFRVGNFLCELRVTSCELKRKITSCKLWLYFTLRTNLQYTQSYFLRVEKIKITSCQSILRVASYYSRVMSYFLQVENKNYELQVMALFHLQKKFTIHSEDRKSLLPV